METPETLRYTDDHEWVRLEAGRATIGITDFAQSALGDVVYVGLPDVGTVVERGATLGEVESTKSVSEVYAPLAGTVVEVNSELSSVPERLNADPYGLGWICVIEVAASEDGADLLDAVRYRELTQS